MFESFKKLPMIMQEELHECGHACLTMIACFWGVQFELPYLRQLFPPHPQGTHLKTLHDIALSLGFEGRALRVTLEELHYVQCPAILHWNMNHFVVLKKVGRKRVVIHDPAVGVLHLTWERVSASFTGIVLELRQLEATQPICLSGRLRLWDWFAWVHGFKPAFIALLCLSTLLEIFHFSSPLLTQYMTDQVIGMHHGRDLKVMMALFFGMICSMALLSLLRSQVSLYLKMKMTTQLSIKVMQHLLSLPLQFFESRQKGDLNSKMNTVHDIQKKLTVDAMTTLLDGAGMVLSATMLWMYSTSLASIVMIGWCMNIIVRGWTYRSLASRFSSALQGHAKAASIFLETLQAMLPVKSFLKESLRLKQWRSHWIAALNEEIVGERLQIRYTLLHELLSQLEYLMVMVCGAHQVLSGTLSIGMLFAFLGFRQHLTQKSTNFMQQVVTYGLLNVQLNRLNDIVMSEPEPRRIPTIQRSVTAGHIRLENISFRYHGTSADVIADLSLEIVPGEKVALIGPSGVGKTTLLKLMMGLLSPTQGHILIDGIRLQDWGVETYRQCIASVMQEDTLLVGSLADNITFFDEHRSLERLYEVARLACIEHWIQQLPMGFETRVGEMGSMLSGGQKQRILLARALYKGPKILFLDEATSHLDTQHEFQMNQALKSLHMTQVIVAHRQETIAMADRTIQIQSPHFLKDTL